MSRYKDYRVVWEIDIVATSAKQAAKIAREIQTDPDGWADVFEVTDRASKKTRRIVLGWRGAKS